MQNKLIYLKSHFYKHSHWPLIMIMHLFPKSASVSRTQFLQSISSTSEISLLEVGRAVSEE